jgi:CspA family cold shock protein
MYRGIVKWFSDQAGFGFLIPEGGGPDVFVHHTFIRADKGVFRSLERDERVMYAVIAGDKGPKAFKVIRERDLTSDELAAFAKAAEQSARPLRPLTAAPSPE